MTDEERRADDLEPFYDRVAEVIHGTASATQVARLEAELRADPRARSAYLHYTLLHAQLSLTDAALMAQAQAVAPDPTDAHTRPPTFLKGLAPRAGRALRDRPWVLGTAAACLIALLVGGLAALRHPMVMPPIGNGAVASLVEARDLVWAQGQAPIVASARLRPQEIRWLGGTLTLAFDSGALVTLVGPADVQVLSDMRLRAARGRITARVQGRATGFAIETPSTVVVDRGTEFGLEVDTSGQTGVVVFKGLVDLSLPALAQGPAPIKRLSQGEGMRIGRTGRMSRIVAVERGSDVDAWSIGPSTDQDVVIRSIRDNLRDLGSPKYYEVVHRGLADGTASYVDRLFQWRGLGPGGLPDFLRGADYIKTFNDDKRTTDLQITVELGPAATLYIFYDDRQATPPWLLQQFTDTGVNIGLDVTADPGWDPKTAPYPFSVWKRDLEPGESISLGANEIGAARSMYGIAAARRP
jgi:hypothetical protein